MTPADLQRIRASQTWRKHRIEVFHDTSQGSVLVKGQRAPRPAWRYRLLNGFARLAGLPLLRAAPAHGGARAQRVEVARLRSLAAAGVPVPRVLHAEDEFFVQSYLGASRLDALLQQEAAALWWRRGLQGLVALHARDQYLSQAFARNFIACGEQLAMIDFEDDPLEVMPLEQAQARDWLAYLHSSARVLGAQSAAQQAAAIEVLRAELARERAPVRRLVGDTARRLRWVRRLSARDGRGWRRHVAILQSAVALMLAAGAPDGNAHQDDKVIHARHH
jgi:tRNA A-37 threonylcarbamoyl transferase component Bud32